MKNSNVDYLNEKINAITEEIQRLSGRFLRPVVAAIDGASGSGKTAIAQLLCSKLQAVIVPLDDFFSSDIPDNQWDKFSVTEKLEKVFDWNRVRTLALEPLRERKQAKWRSFDFLAGIQQDGTYLLKKEETIINPSEIIIIEGAYSSCSFLADLIDLTILIYVPAEERHKRLSIREGDSEFLKQWHQRWDIAENYYFECIRPQNSFDFIIEG
jgi:uridine kinase